MRKLTYKKHIKSPFFATKDVQSATDQTGLMQTVPDDEAEAINYERLYPVHRQKPKS